MNKELYLSYSRAYTFITDKKKFVEKYIFGCKPKESASRIQLKKFHDMFEKFCKYDTYGDALMNNPKYITFSDTDNYLKPNTKARKQAELEGKIFITETEETALISHLEQLQMKPFSIVKDILKKSVSEEMIYDEKHKYRGRCDFFALNEGVVELKSQSEDSFRMMKFRYGLQQVFYTNMLDNFNFYFLLAPQTFPYELKLVDIDSEYLAAIEKYLEEEVSPKYFKFIEKALEFDPKIFEWKGWKAKGMDGEEKPFVITRQKRIEVYNYLYDIKFLKHSKVFNVREWEINNVLKGEV